MGRKPIHDQVAEILPWFVNNSLGQREQTKVLLHLRECEACQAERDRLQALQGLLQEDPAVLPDYRFAYSRLLSRIEGAEANRVSTQGFGRRSQHHLRYLLGAAASLLAAVMLVAALDDSPGDEARGQFRTLTSTPGVDAAGVPHRVALRFEQPIQADTLRRVLIENRASIISGPSEEGTYLLEINIPSTVSDVAFLAQLESIDGVSYVAFRDRSSGTAP
ncbi:MAG: hypothetical protein ACFHX7_19735 [Pseudomonadota bacterium]